MTIKTGALGRVHFSNNLQGEVIKSLSNHTLRIVKTQRERELMHLRLSGKVAEKVRKSIIENYFCI